MKGELARIVIGLAVLIALSVGVYLRWDSYKADMAELQELREYKASVEVREELSEALRATFEAIKADAGEQAREAADYRHTIETLTEEVAREDQASADFLAMPIPERLRNADREARLARGLGAGARPGDAADGAH